jgi:hypothetical protein
MMHYLCGLVFCTGPMVNRKETNTLSLDTVADCLGTTSGTNLISSGHSSDHSWEPTATVSCTCTVFISGRAEILFQVRVSPTRLTFHIIILGSPPWTAKKSYSSNFSTHRVAIFIVKNSRYQMTFLWSKRNRKFWEELIAYYPLIRQGLQRKYLQQMFAAAGTCLPCRCLATIGVIHTDWWEGFKKYDVEMGSCDMNVHTKFHKDRFRHLKSDETVVDTDSEVISQANVYFFRIRKVG